MNSGNPTFHSIILWLFYSVDQAKTDNTLVNYASKIWVAHAWCPVVPLRNIMSLSLSLIKQAVCTSLFMYLWFNLVCTFSHVRRVLEQLDTGKMLLNTTLGIMVVSRYIDIRIQVAQPCKKSVPFSDSQNCVATHGKVRCKWDTFLTSNKICVATGT